MALSSLAVSQLKHAQDNQDRDVKEQIEKMQDALRRLQAPTNALDVALGQNAFFESQRRLKAIQGVSHAGMVAELIFVSIFSSFDAYLNHLLRDLYSRLPRLLHTLSQKEIQFSELLKHSKDEIIESAINSDLDGLLRENYTKIFEKLELKFKLSTLRKFDNWPAFIECSQRRNIITHCDGIANRHYLDVCISENAPVDAGIKVGLKIGVSQAYLLKAIEVVSEVGLKLGQVLWRTIGAPAIAAADVHLAELLFDLLKLENWTLALRMGEFGQELCKLPNQQQRSDRSLKMIIINHAQAAKWSGDLEGASRIVDVVEWSGSSHEFCLAVACIKEEWDNASKLMHEIGPNAKFMPIHGYVGWPIFREFRTKDQFSSAFRSIFGVEFVSEVRKETESPQILEDESHATGSNP